MLLLSTTSACMPLLRSRAMSSSSFIILRLVAMAIPGFVVERCEEAIVKCGSGSRWRVRKWAWTREGAHGKVRFGVAVRQNDRVVRRCSNVGCALLFVRVRVLSFVFFRFV
jgi:hypothetical protein